MTPSPSTPPMNPERSDAILGMLRATVSDDQDARLAARRQRRTRGILIASAATAAVVVAAGVGYGVTAGSRSTTPGDGGGLAVPTSEPAAPSPSSTPTASLPPGVDPAGTATPVPTPTPTATATPTLDLANPSSWVITFEGVGPLTIGGSQTAEAAAMQHAFDGAPQVLFGGQACPAIFFHRHSTVPNAPGMISQADPAGGTTTLVAVGTSYLPSDPADLPTFSANSPKTAQGIGVGSTLDQLRKAYPGIANVGTGYETFFGIQDSTGEWMSFGMGARDIIDTIIVSDQPVGPPEYCG